MWSKWKIGSSKSCASWLEISRDQYWDSTFSCHVLSLLINSALGQSAPQQVCEWNPVWMLEDRAAFKGSLISWKNRLRGPWWSSRKRNSKSWSWYRIIPCKSSSLRTCISVDAICPDHSQGIFSPIGLDGKWPWRKGPGDSNGRLIQHESATYLCIKGSQPRTELY